MAKRFISGLRIEKNTLEYSTLQDDGQKISVFSSRQLDLKGSDELWSDVQSLSNELQRQCPELGGTITLGISSENLILRVVELPSTEPDEIKSMIELQVDKLSPFADEKMSSSYEILKISEKNCFVLIVVMQRDKLELLGKATQNAGFDLQRIDIDVMGWWRVLEDKKDVIPSGRQLILRIESKSCCIIIAQDGIPIVFKTIIRQEEMSEEEYYEEIINESNSLILAIDLEQGASPLIQINCWSQNINQERVTSRLKKEFKLEVQIGNLTTLPPVSEGLAWRMLNPPFIAKRSISHMAETHAVIDLFPESWRERSTSLKFKQQLILSAAIIAGIWLIGMAILIVGHHLELRKSKNLEAQIAILEKPANEIRLLRKQVTSFEQHLDRKHSALECLREVTVLLPKDIDLTSVQFKKANSILLRGESLSVNPIYDFKQALDKSDLFIKIVMGSVQPSKRKNKTVQTFQMNILIPEEN